MDGLLIVPGSGTEMNRFTAEERGMQEEMPGDCVYVPVLLVLLVDKFSAMGDRRKKIKDQPTGFGGIDQEKWCVEMINKHPYWPQSKQSDVMRQIRKRFTKSEMESKAKDEELESLRWELETLGLELKMYQDHFGELPEDVRDNEDAKKKRKKKK